MEIEEKACRHGDAIGPFGPRGGGAMVPDAGEGAQHVADDEGCGGRSVQTLCV